MGHTGCCQSGGEDGVRPAVSLSVIYNSKRKEKIPDVILPI